MRVLLLVFVVCFITGCGKSDPYEGKPTITTEEPEEPADVVPVVTPPPPPEPKDSKLGMDVPDVMTFREGETGVYPAQAMLSGVGTLEFIFNKLPPGMVYDAAKKTITWQPTYQDGDDPSNPTASYKLYIIEVIARVIEAPTNNLIREIPVIVDNVVPETSIVPVVEEPEVTLGTPQPQLTKK